MKLPDASSSICMSPWTTKSSTASSDIIPTTRSAWQLSDLMGIIFLLNGTLPYHAAKNTSLKHRSSCSVACAKFFGTSVIPNVWPAAGQELKPWTVGSQREKICTPTAKFPAHGFFWFRTSLAWRSSSQHCQCWKTHRSFSILWHRQDWESEPNWSETVCSRHSRRNWEDGLSQSPWFNG
jgi:hypothetical protein